jgi:hypothetical protein
MLARRVAIALRDRGASGNQAFANLNSLQNSRVKVECLQMKRKLRPMLQDAWRLIGPSPDFAGVLPGAEAARARWEDGGRKWEHNAPVDHHLFRGPDGKWPLWGCVRNTVVGRVLYHWSDWKTVHREARFGGSIHYRCECPHVVERDGYFYLFRTEEYDSHRTHVFRSEDPMDFGVDDARAKYVGYLPAAAVEVYEVNGQEYVASNHNPILGTQLCRLERGKDA